MNRVGEVKDYTTISPPVPSEVLASIAVSNRKEIVAKNLELVTGNKELLRSFVARHPKHLGWHSPVAGTMAFVELLNGFESTPYSHELFDRAGLLVMPGDLFEGVSAIGGGKGEEKREFLRVTFGRGGMEEMLAVWEKVVCEMEREEAKLEAMMKQ